MSMCIHIDGSALRNVRTQKSSKNWTMGWAIIVNHGEMERYGAVTINQDIRGEHEMIAFIEGVIYAKSCGVAPEDLTVYTDDQLIGYANFYMWEGNYSGHLREKLIERCRKVLDAIYCSDLLSTMIAYLSGAKIHKLKGHIGLIYQERADYLAKYSAYSHRGEQSETFLSYEEWLFKGFIRYNSNKEAQVKYPPFVGTN